MPPSRELPLPDGFLTGKVGLNRVPAGPGCLFAYLLAGRGNWLRIVRKDPHEQIFEKPVQPE